MIHVHVNNLDPRTSELRQFEFRHNAITWLLLSGFLPLEDSSEYHNLYTGARALIIRMETEQ